MKRALLILKYFNLFVNTILPTALQLVKHADLVKEDIKKIKQDIEDSKKKM